MNETNDLTADQKRSLLQNHLMEVIRLSIELSATDAADFGVSIGPEIPNLTTARQDPKVQCAMATLKEAEAELGIAKIVLGIADILAARFGFALA